MKVKQLEADQSVIGTLEITDRLTGYSVKVHGTNIYIY